MANSIFHLFARIPEHIEPIDRGERYEDPLSLALEAENLGQVTGGGSQLDEHYRIAFVELEIELADLTRGVPLVISTLESLGAPRGSVLTFEQNGQTIEHGFGTLQLAELYLDGINLPAQVYEQLDFATFHDALRVALEGIGEPRGVWTGNEETALFIFAKDSNAVAPLLEPLVATHPILQGARVVARAGGDGEVLSEIKLPTL